MFLYFRLNVNQIVIISTSKGYLVVNFYYMVYMMCICYGICDLFGINDCDEILFSKYATDLKQLTYVPERLSKKQQIVKDEFNMFDKNKNIGELGYGIKQ